MIERKEIERVVKQIFFDFVGSYNWKSVEELSLDKHIVDDYGADSLDCVEIAMDLEEHFCIELPEKEFDTVKTLKDICDLVEKKVKK